MSAIAAAHAHGKGSSSSAGDSTFSVSVRTLEMRKDIKVSRMGGKKEKLFICYLMIVRKGSDCWEVGRRFSELSLIHI